MKKELILKIDDSNDDVEICSRENNQISYKAIKKNELVKLLKKYCIDEKPIQRKDIVMLDEQIIGMGSSSVLINQKQHQRIVTLAIYAEKTFAFKINMPNALYILQYHDANGERKITNIEAYSYKKFNGDKTVLFEYPMPNEIYGNAICIGTAPRLISDCNYVDALDQVIFTSYTHANLSSVNGFTNSLKWFEYLSENEFPYKMLKPLKKKLKDILHG